MIAIAIDGPAGAGKSTLAKHLARELGYIYVDTGALYRAVGLYALRAGKNPKSADEVLPLLPSVNVRLAYQNGEQRVFLGDEDVSGSIRSNEASMAASDVSAIQGVRDFLFDLQKNMADTHNVVMDGRDIGTVVLPHAQIKIFLTASAEERATRRYKELLQKGEQAIYADILEQVKQRDYNDSNRAAAPLRKAEDAEMINTTGYTLEESAELLLNFVKGRLNNVL